MSKFSFTVPRDRLEVRTSRSGGAGGQHVNKVETKIEIRFKLDSADWIPLAVRERMRMAFASRINREGEFSVTSDETRSQGQNLEIAVEKLVAFVESCWRAPKKRVKTQPTRSSKERRLSAKKLVGDKKRSRGRSD